MNYGHAAKELLIERIIQLLIKRPTIPALEVIKIMEKNGYPKLTESYVDRIKKIANAALLHRARRTTKKMAHAQLLGTMEEGLSMTWGIATGAESATDRLKAVIVIVKLAEQRYGLQLAADEFEDDLELETLRAARKEERDAAVREKTAVPAEDIEASGAAAEKSGYQLPPPENDLPSQEEKPTEEKNGSTNSQ